MCFADIVRSILDVVKVDFCIQLDLMFRTVFMILLVELYVNGVC